MMPLHRKPLLAARPAHDSVLQAPALDPRIPRWRRSALIERACPVCHGADSVPIVRRPDGLVVSRCGACSMIYLAVIPDSAALQEFYAAYSRTHQRRNLTDAVAARAAAKRRRGGNGLLNEIKRLRPLRGKRLLEIGCSTGPFLLDAQLAGAEVSGMEVDASARQFVQDRLNIACSATLDALVERGPYDIVVALNLIEHLPDPATWLRLAGDMIAPGGLCVLWTPNGGEALEQGLGWVGFRVDLDHLNYFSIATLSRLLQQAQLWPEAVWTCKQAELAGFRHDGGPVAVGRVGTVLNRFARAGRPSWTLPAHGGSYMLCVAAGKP
jgi:2-polyprenyl-3-methyl-5-hydroxy-6-metoxy-1,4-benzoquinol methylase